MDFSWFSWSDFWQAGFAVGYIVVAMIACVWAVRLFRDGVVNGENYAFDEDDLDAFDEWDENSDLGELEFVEYSYSSLRTCPVCGSDYVYDYEGSTGGPDKTSRLTH